MNGKYGSELHLLRWMGRHRAALIRKIERVSGLRAVDFLPFPFAAGTKCDSEYLRLDFLSADERSRVKDFCQSLKPNWDAVAVGLNDRDERVYVLIEAKAHAGEIRDHKRHGGRSRDKILKAMEDAANGVVHESGLGEIWMGDYYQLANRLYVHWLLQKSGIKSVLVDVFFCGDNHKGVFCPKEPNEWRDAIDIEYKALHLDTMHGEAYLAAHLRELYIDVRSDKDMMTF